MTLILGLGNPVRCDDGVGLQVIERLRGHELPAGVELAEAGTAGLAVLDLIAGCQRLVIVDAVAAGLAPGTVVELLLDRPDPGQTPLHLASSHELDLVAVLELGKRLGLDLPAEIRVVGIQVADVETFAEQCTPAVAAAVDAACALALELALAPPAAAAAAAAKSEGP